MACPSLAGAVAASPRAAMELLDRGTLFSLLPLIIGGGSASASHLIRGPLAWCSLLHDDIGGKGIGEQAERGGADRCGPARDVAGVSAQSRARLCTTAIVLRWRSKNGCAGSGWRSAENRRPAPRAK